MAREALHEPREWWERTATRDEGATGARVLRPQIRGEGRERKGPIRTWSGLGEGGGEGGRIEFMCQRREMQT